jgi:hypothetical protein
MATYTLTVETVDPGSIPQADTNFTQAPLQPTAAITLVVETFDPGAFPQADTNYTPAPLQPTAAITLVVETVDPGAFPQADTGYLPAPMQAPLVYTLAVETVDPGLIPQATANLIQAPIQSPLTWTIPVETVQATATIVSISEEDVVAQFVMAAVPTSRTTLYTVPVGRTAVIRWMDLVNTTGSAITVDVWLNNVQWENDRSVPGNDKYARDTITTLGPGQLIEMQASGAGVNGFMSGVLELAS